MCLQGCGCLYVNVYNLIWWGLSIKAIKHLSLKQLVNTKFGKLTLIIKAFLIYPLLPLFLITKACHMLLSGVLLALKHFSRTL